MSTREEDRSEQQSVELHCTQGLAHLTVAYVAEKGAGRLVAVDIARPRPPRACYALCTMKVTNRCAISMAKATKCRPANVSDKRS